ncbi:MULTISPECIES: hypothetical protein [Pseudomonas syringae group]|uniref:Integron protein cassette protein n=3 Tax=root TaxID=1 RepID=A0AAW4DPA0_PSESX|nr:MULTISPECIES: hypothetical protein [Pseudomonas syringae group]YP_010772937.1 hypothetical protein QIT78_gp07 [Pseudomonas phage Medea1]KGK92146.1 hypothetical protein NB04_28235 [Pseudomonas syringae pv. tomato]KUR47613.1 hypothetical protein PSTA9_01466 [Pseudomonas syringae pv. tomato]KUR48018.1 hypothetical protein PST407_02277 [Pseudomonas syringae pv. tomato]MBI6711607.1 hypothetical protein [Pseudomonas syringae]MBI6735946.1 hypothetical protein [Pseudomonas syringae]
MRSILMIALALSILSGCASKPTPEQIQAANYGASVYQVDAEKAVRSFFQMYLKDPDSARYSFGTVYKGYVVGSVFEGRKVEGGYLLEVAVNAKNSFGGYVGARNYRFLIRNDRLVGGWDMGTSNIPVKIL